MTEQEKSLTKAASMSLTDKITDPNVATKMVLKYANTLLGDKRAQKFYAQTALMMRNNPKLAQVDAHTLFVAMMACVHTDLMPNTPEGYAYIIPYGNVAQFQLGYKGLAELAFRSGVVKALNAELVFPEDDFGIELGTERRLRHVPPLIAGKERSYDRATHIYATAKLNNGETVFEVMSKAEVDKIRGFSKTSSSDSPWRTWPEAMAKKTVVKRLLKLLPSSTADNRFKEAATWDSLQEAGKKLSVNDQGEIIEGETADSVEVNGALDRIQKAATQDEVFDIITKLPVNVQKQVTAAADAKVKELAHDGQ